MGLRIHPQASPKTAAVLAYLALACTSLILFCVLFLQAPQKEMTPDLRTLALLHLLAIGFGASAFIGVARHMALTTLNPKLRQEGHALWAPGIHALATGFLVGGFLAARLWLCGLAGLLVATELALLFISLRPAIRERSQTGSLHGFTIVAGACLALVSLLGAGFGFFPDLASGTSLREVHAFLAGAGFFTVAIMGASSQLVPMFSASPTPKKPYLPQLLLGVLAGLLAGTGALLFGWPGIGEAWMLATVVLWLLFQTRAWRTGHPRLAEPFFFLARVGELSLVAAAGVLLVGGPAVFAAAVFFLGFLIPTVLGYLSRIVPFLLWLFLVERFGFERTIPKIDRYLPRRVTSVAGGCYIAGLALTLATMAGPFGHIQVAGRLLLALGAVIYVGCLATAGLRARDWIARREP